MDGFNSFDTEYKGIDTSNTPAPDYSPNNIPEPIKRRSTWVRGKNKLIAMREALGQGLEVAGITAFNAERIAQKTQYRQDAVEDQFDAVQRTATETADWGGEIIVASDGETTLANRLNRDRANIRTDIMDTSLNVNFFGAVGDGVADDTASIQATIDAGTLKGDYGYSTVTLPSGYNYRVTSTITVPRHIHFIIEGRIVYDGPETAPAIIIGDATRQNYKSRIQIDIVRKTQSSWTDINDTGVLIHNPYTCQINIFNVERFRNGFEIRASNGLGATMSRIDINNLTNNQIGTFLTCITNGWNTANRFFGGLWIRDLIHSDKTSHSVQTLRLDNTGVVSNHIFYSPNFEAYKHNVPINFDANSHAMKIVESRSENNSDEAYGYIKNSNGVEVSEVYGKEQSNTIYANGDGGTTPYVDNQKKLVHTSGRWSDTIKSFPDANGTNWNNVPYAFARVTTEYPFNNLLKSALEYNSTLDYVKFNQVNEGICFALDTKQAKVFDLTIQADKHFDIAIKNFNNETAVIKNSSAEDTQSWGTSKPVRPNFKDGTWYFGGTFLDTTVNNPYRTKNEYRFEVSPSTQYCHVYIYSTEPESILHGFDLQSHKYPSRIWRPIENI